MDVPPTPMPFRVRLDGRPLVEVDGVDVTAAVTGVEFTSGFGEPSALVLHVSTPGVLEGTAVVHVATAGGGQAVRDLDPAVVQAKVLERNLSMADDPFAAMLDVVADLLDEGTS